MPDTPVSLLERICRSPSETEWQRLTDLYSPLIRNFLRRHNVLEEDADDLVQDVLLVVSQKIGDFNHNQRTGAFRTWLRSITANRLGDFWRAKRIRPVATGNSAFQEMLTQLESPSSELSRQWNEEHDEHVLNSLLQLIEPEFEPTTWLAFKRVAIDQIPATEVAEELGISKNAVYIAKSRVLNRLRHEAKGLVDS